MTALLPFLLFSSLAAQEPEAQSIAEALAAGDTIRVDGVLFLMNDAIITESMVAVDAERLLRVNPGRLIRNPEGGRSEAFSQALSHRLLDVIAREGFDRLGLDYARLKEEVDGRIQVMIDEAGSRARFDQSIRLRGHDVASFRAALEAELITVTWRSIVTGEQPSPLEGRRSQIVITPAEIREAYLKDPEKWKQEQSLVWTTFQFFDSDEGTGIERALAMAGQLRAKTAGLAEAKAAANSSFQSKGDPVLKGLRADLRDFLVGAQEGDVSDVDPIPNLGAQLILLETILPAREIGFSEAQESIAEALREARYTQIMNAAIEDLNSSSYVWFPAELKDFMSTVPGLTRKEVEETEF